MESREFMWHNFHALFFLAKPKIYELFFFADERPFLVYNSDEYILLHKPFILFNLTNVNFALK